MNESNKSQSKTAAPTKSKLVKGTKRETAPRPCIPSFMP
jgi:hypothetical protein